MKEYSAEALARAEYLLKAAAAQGHSEAKASLESWPLLKAAAERHITLGPTSA